MTTQPKPIPDFATLIVRRLSAALCTPTQWVDAETLLTACGLEAADPDPDNEEAGREYDLAIGRLEKRGEIHFSKTKGKWILGSARR